MRKIVVILTAILFLAVGCGNRQAKRTNNELVNEQNLEPVEGPVKLIAEGLNKVEVNYASNKELLDIILLLPDSAFSTWDWKIEDRKEWYNEIKTNNFWIDKDTMFFNQIYFKPNTACFQIVDGIWTVSKYRTSDNSFIVITNDIAGNGNEVNIFEAKDNELIKSMDFELLFGNYKDQIRLNDLPQECGEKLTDFEDPIFLFDFSDENKVEIESSWYLTKEKFKDCLNGNTILYKFNPKTKKFEIDRIYWKPKKKN
ncbi:hypothetical protein LJC68_10650 [Bacteroidales bacterium OttesenSCG-928-B11]|nr:hypothetical protein [Bacteroidales bacterium OttesenSCG-928-B11]